MGKIDSGTCEWTVKNGGGDSGNQVRGCGPQSGCVLSSPKANTITALFITWRYGIWYV